MPSISVVLRTQDIPLILLVADPLLCLFAKSAPHATVFRLWDVFFLEGRSAVPGAGDSERGARESSPSDDCFAFCDEAGGCGVCARRRLSRPEPGVPETPSE